MSAFDGAEKHPIRRRRNLERYLVLVAIIGLLQAGCRRRPSNDLVWEVLLPWTPARVSTELAENGAEHYVLKQTHEPLFRKDDGQNFRSRVLKSWSRNVDSTAFEFCPNTALSFDEDHFFTAPSLRENLERITKRFAPSFSVTREGDCVSVRFQHRENKYLDFLAVYENAPSLKTKDPNVEVGLGPFMVKDITPEKIVLRRKKAVVNGYNIIIFHLYKGPTDPNLANRNIADFNQIPASDIPGWVLNEYQGLSKMLLGTYVLIINHPDAKVRAAIYNCMDVDGFRRAYFPGMTEFYDLMTVLPVGVPGAQAGRPEQVCGAVPLRSVRHPLVLVDWRSGNEAPLRAVLAAFTRKTGIPVELRNVNPNALMELAVKHQHPYNLVVLIGGSARAAYDIYFNYTLSRNRQIDFDLTKARQLYARLGEEDDSVKQTMLAMEIAAEISRQAAVLPLFQDVRRFYYPRGLKNLTIGRDFLEFPEVGDFEL